MTFSENTLRNGHQESLHIHEYTRDESHKRCFTIDWKRIGSKNNKHLQQIFESKTCKQAAMKLKQQTMAQKG